MTLSFVTIEKLGNCYIEYLEEWMFNKENEHYLSDVHLKNGDQAFESGFSNKGPEFEYAFQEEKAEKRHSFLTLALPLILLSVSWGLVLLSWKYKPIIVYLAVIVACFVL